MSEKFMALEGIVMISSTYEQREANRNGLWLIEYE